MKPRIFTAVMLFISAYSPLFLVFIVKNFDFNKYVFKDVAFVIILTVVIIISLLLLYLSFRKISRGNTVYNVVSVRNRSNEFTNYAIPYLLSFLGNNLGSWGDVISVIIFLIVLMVLTIKSQTVFINPILAFFGYSLYEIEYSFDDKKFTNLFLCKISVKANNAYYIRCLSPHLYLIVEQQEIIGE